MNSLDKLNVLWEKGLDFLGTKYSILGGAMSWVSDHHLVSGISNAGGFGVIACGSMTPELLDQEIKNTKKLTSNPFGVNLITMHPQLFDLADVCGANKVSHVVLAGGLPTSQIIQHLKAYDIKVMAFAPTVAIAKKLTKSGVDALIIEGSEAGGHIGPVSTSVLAQEVLPAVKDFPVFVAGGIGRGEVIVNYLQMGACGCQLGTHFVCAYESKAHANFKNAFIKANSRDAIPSVQLDPRFTVIPVRAIVNEASDQFMTVQRKVVQSYDKGEITLQEGQLQIEHFWAGALRKAVIDGDIQNGSLMAGQSVGMVTKEQSCKDIIQEFTTQALQFLDLQSSL